jgi:hypothetical protein
MQEFYNLRHSSLRNVIERTYGAMKSKFPILRTMTSYSIDDQAEIIIGGKPLFNDLQSCMEV